MAKRVGKETWADGIARLRSQIAEDFVRPQFTRSTVAEALGLPFTTFGNWQQRGRMVLDGDAARTGAQWRSYSPRDVLRLGIAAHLANAGIPPERFLPVIEEIDARFPLSPTNPLLGTDVPTWFVVTPEGATIGPTFGAALEGAAIPAAAFTALRIDQIAGRSLERLGYAHRRAQPQTAHLKPQAPGAAGAQSPEDPE